MAKAAIAIDPWKLAVFDKHLSKAGYDYEQTVDEHGIIILIVKKEFNSTSELDAIGKVAMAANDEAAMIGAPS